MSREHIKWAREERQSQPLFLKDRYNASPALSIRELGPAFDDLVEESFRTLLLMNSLPKTVQSSIPAATLSTHSSNPKPGNYFSKRK